MSAHSAGYEARALSALKETVVYVTATGQVENLEAPGAYYKVSNGVVSMKIPAQSGIPIGHMFVVDNFDNAQALDLNYPSGSTGASVPGGAILLMVNYGPAFQYVQFAEF